MTELNIEIAKLRKEIDQYNQDNSTYLSYEKKYVNIITFCDKHCFYVNLLYPILYIICISYFI
jgi:hypothetical protein